MSNKTKIKIFASTKKFNTYDRHDENKVIEVIRKDVLPKIKKTYHSVSVKVERSTDGTAKYLIAYMLRNDSYTADVTKVDMDLDYNVQDIIENYDDSQEIGDEAEEEPDSLESHEVNPTFDFVVATPVPDIPTAKAAVEAIAAMVVVKGLKCKVLLGSDASIANYKQYLSSGLQGFINVGHGWPGGIVLDDGPLRSTWFEALTNSPLSPAIVYFNSCQVYNAPLLPSVINSGSRTYIGGITNLLIGPSEEVCKSFWNKILFEGARMKEALLIAEEDNYPNTEALGFDGDTGVFSK